MRGSNLNQLTLFGVGNYQLSPRKIITKLNTMLGVIFGVIRDAELNEIIFIAQEIILTDNISKISMFCFVSYISIFFSNSA